MMSSRPTDPLFDPMKSRNVYVLKKLSQIALSSFVFMKFDKRFLFIITVSNTKPKIFCFHSFFFSCLSNDNIPGKAKSFLILLYRNNNK